MLSEVQFSFKPLHTPEEIMAEKKKKDLTIEADKTDGGKKKKKKKKKKGK
jgi:hypothetical protein